MARVTATASGAIASFKSPGKVPIRNLQVNFLPKQAGSGDPSPQNVRSITGLTGVTASCCGQNLFDISTVTYGKWTTGDGAVGDLSYGCRSEIIPCKSGDTINLTVFGTVYSKSIVPCKKDGTYVSRTHSSGDSSLTYTAATDGYFYVQVANGLETSNPIDATYLQNAKIVVTRNSVPTAYVAYTGTQLPVTFPAVGKNLFDNTFFADYDAYLTSGNYGYKYTENLYLKPNTTYTIKPNASGTLSKLSYYAIVGDNQAGVHFTKYIVNNYSYGTDYTFSTGSDGAVQFCFYNSAGTKQEALDEMFTAMQIQLEEGSSATTYEAFTNTIYGGTVDIVTGVLTAEWCSVEASDLTWVETSQTANGVFRSSLPYQVAKGNDESFIVCDKYKTIKPEKSISGDFQNNQIKGYNSSIPDYSKYVYIRDNRYTTLADFSANIDAFIVFKMYEPITYQLTASQISSLIGQNTVFSDADSVSVTYDYAEPLDFVKKRMTIAAICDAAKPYQVTGNPAMFNTNIAKNLRSLSAAVTPTQEGTGDASTSNIRKINGWTSMNIYKTGKNLLPNTEVKGEGNQYFLCASSSGYPFKLKAGTYTLSHTGKAAYAYRNKYGSSDSSMIHTNSVDHGTFTITEDGDYRIWFYTANATASDFTNIQLEYGSSATTYEAPKSVTDIAFTIPALGKNLFDKTRITTSRYINSQGNTTAGSTGQAVTGLIPVEPGEVITISHNKSSSFNSCFYSQAQISTNYAVPYTSSGKTFTNSLYPVTVPAGAKYLAITYNPTNTDVFQVERGTTSTTYEEFTNTVYGGSVDIVKGKATITHVCIEVPSTYTWSNMSSYFVLWNSDTNLEKSASAFDATLVSHFKNSGGYSNSLFVNGAGNVFFGTILLSQMGISTSDGINSWIAGQKENGAPVQICYELTEPYTIDIMPTQVHQLVGDNTVWTNTNGTNTITYLKRG